MARGKKVTEEHREAELAQPSAGPERVAEANGEEKKKRGPGPVYLFFGKESEHAPARLIGAAPTKGKAHRLYIEQRAIWEGHFRFVSCYRAKLVPIDFLAPSKPRQSSRPQWVF